nr:isopeptide-forming domain-containing fimbrial protein [Knoellia sp. DB2414S]
MLAWDSARGVRALRRVASLVSVALVLSMLTFVVQVIQNPTPAAADQNPTSCGTVSALQNGNFETPVVPNGAGTNVLEGTPGLFWNTTATDNLIEYWRGTITTSNGGLSISPQSGSQWAELNATQASALYQDLPTVPGTTMRWSLWHRARSTNTVSGDQTNTMSVKIGSTGAPVEQRQLTTSDAAWVNYTGTYTVPAGQTTTRFQFEAITGSGGPTLGNFLDNITFGTAPCIILDKQVVDDNGGNTVPGDTLTYTVKATNNGGDAALTSAITDAIPPGTTYVPGSITVDGAAKTDGAGDDQADFGNNTVTARVGTGATATTGGTIAAGSSSTITFKVKVNASAAAGASIANTANATYSWAGDNVTRTSTSQTTTNTVQTEGITLAKSAGTPVDANGSGRLDAGDTVAYTFVVRNTGSTALSNVVVSDPKVGPVSCPSTSLASGASMTCTKTYTITQPDMDAGAVNNTATASGRPAGAVADVSATSTATTNLAPTGTLVLDKSHGTITDPDGNGLDAGDQVPYTFKVTNTGTVTLTGVSVTDPKVGTVTCPTTTLAPGASTTCTASYTLTQPDLDAGRVDNTASASGKTPLGATATGTDTDTTPLPFTGTLDLTKAANKSSVSQVGESITYTFTATNSSNRTMTGVRITDPKAGLSALSCTPAQPATLAPGVKLVCTATYTVTQSDLDAGAVTNTATATGTPANGTAVTSAPSTATVPAVDAAAIDLTKTALGLTDVDGNGPDQGDTITFGFTVRNTGNTTLNAITVTDPMLGTITCPQTSLAPGATMTCTSVTYTVTQPDVDAGAVNNTATAKATSARGTAVQDPSSTSTSLARTAVIGLTKSVAKVNDVNGNGVTDPGDTVQYSFTATNTGNTTLSSITVNDPKLGGTVTCAAGPLAPGASVTCTPAQTYTVTAADQTAGKVTNTATASATSSAGTASSNQATATVTVATPASLNVTKTQGSTSTVDPTTGRFTVTYTVTVTNSGQTPTTYGALTDTPQFASTIAIDGVIWSGPVSGSSSTAGPWVLAPAGTAIGGSTTQTYAVTVTAHSTTTTAATACGGPGTGLYNSVALPAGQEKGATTDNAACVAPPAAPTTSMSLTKSVASVQDVNGNGLTDAGDKITYSFLVRNTGTVDLTATTVSDPKLAGAGITITCADPVLSPGETTVCAPSAAYTITASDMAAGTVTNTATVTGTPPNNLPKPTATSSTSTPTQTASMTLAKSVGTVNDLDGNGRDAGDTVVYTFQVTNTGNTTLGNVVVNDARLGLSGYACGTGSLAPGASRTCTATYTLTQGDINAGSITNTASVVATPPGGATPVSATGTATLTTTGTNGIELTKTASSVMDANGNGVADAGDEIEYSFSVRNTGTTTLTNVLIDDAKLNQDDLLCTAGPLAPGATATCRTGVAYIITQADVNAGAVTNTASVTATPPYGTVPTDTDSTSTSIDNLASIDLTKTPGQVVDANGSGRVDAGDTITYTFTVRNTSNVPLTGVVINDTKLGLTNYQCGTGTVDPLTTITCTSPAYRLTQADIDAGRVDNTASVRGTDPNNNTVSDSSTASVTFTPAASASLVKTGGAVNDLDGNGPDAGDTIVYTFAVTNTGAQSLSSITVSDPKLNLSGYLCSAGPLAPGATVTCQAPTPYVLTQADVDAGRVDNTATTTAVPALGGSVTAQDAETVTVTPRSSLTFDKASRDVVDVDGNGPDAGDTVSYSFTVTNTGAASLNNIRVTDAKLGLNGFLCSAGPLAPGASVTCTSPAYTITQADVDAGQVVNTATATATPSTGGTVTGSDREVSPLTPVNSMSLTKTGGAVKDVDSSGSPSPGDTIDYTFTVTNTGSATLSNVTVTDSKLGLSGWLCTAGPLAPGATATCAAPVTYRLTQADINAGKVDNTATATAVAASGTSPRASDSETRPVTQVAGIDLTKTAGAPTTSGGRLPGSTDAGDTVTYTFTVRNTSNVTLTGVTIDDPKLNVTDLTCGTTTLEPGQTTTCTRTYTLTQGDVDALRVDNTATVTGQDPRGADVTDSATVSTPVAPASSVDLVKTGGTPTTAGGTDPNRTDAGDTVTYTFTATNTGGTSLSTLTITDPTLGLTDYFCADGSIAPGATVSCTATHSLTQGDIDAGRVDNTATVNGTSPTGPVTDTASTTVTVPQAGSLTVDKRDAGIVDNDGNGADQGDTISYTFTVTNTGTTTLAPVTITDTKLGLTDFQCVASLAPGESTTCAAPAAYVLTQGDVDNGVVHNDVTAKGNAATGTDPTATDANDVPITNLASLTLAKDAGPVADTNGSGRLDAGDTVSYTFRVTNTSNVTLTGLTVTDPLLAGAGVGIACPTTTLAPGASTTCTSGAYTLTQADIDRGRVDNTATATARNPQGGTVTATDPATVQLTPASSVRLTKSAGAISDGDGNGPDAGDTIAYTFTVTDTGATTVTNPRIADAKLGLNGFACGTTSLAPGASTTCTATYTLTQADVDAGAATNTATVTVDTPTGTATGSDGTTTTVTPRNSIVLTKTAGSIVDVDEDGRPSEGDTVEYTFTVQNTGASTLSDVTIDDAKLGLSGFVCTPGPLAPGASTTCQATKVYALTQDDVDAGTVENTATASATASAGANPADTDSETLTIDRVTSIEIDKTSGTPTTAGGRLPGVTDAGDTITYSFTVTNTANTRLTGVAVSDPMLASAGVAITCPSTSLAPNASMTCTSAPYSLTQDDIDTGRVTNTASVDGTSPTGPVTDSAVETRVLAPTSTLSLDKAAGPVADVDGNGPDAGDTVTFTFTVTNTGATTVDTVTVTDERINVTGMPCGAGPLAPGASRSCTSPAYVLTQADVDAGGFRNVATVSAVPPGGGTPVTATDDAVVTVGSSPAVAVSKTAGAPTVAAGRLDTVTDAGDTVEFTITVTNTGNVTLSPVRVTDELVGWSGRVCGGDDSLAPGESTTCTVTHTVTQAEIDAGSVTNAASAVGATPTGTSVTASDDVTVPLAPTNAISFTKNSSGVRDLDGNGPDAGDTIDYTFTVTNDGSTTLAPVTIDDPMLGLDDFSCAPSLAPGATLTCEAPAPYVLTQADVDAGAVTNAATATGDAPTGTDPTDDAATTTALTNVAALRLVKTAGTPTVAGGDLPTVTDAGDTVTYSFTVTNDSNLTLTGVEVADPMLGDVTCDAATLAPRASTTCTAAPHVLTQAEIDAGRVANTATASATQPDGTGVSDADTATVTIDGSNSVDLRKTAGEPTVAAGSDPQRTDAGDSITYAFAVTNTGNQTLSTVTVADARLGVTGLACAPTLAPGDTATCTATYTLTQADLDAGVVRNTATATATPPGGATPVTDDATATSTLPTSPGIAIDKVAGEPTVSGGRLGTTTDAGDTITYTLTVTNTGTVTLRDVEITDEKLGLAGVPCSGASTLAPGASATCTFTYTLAQPDIDAGGVTNIASVTGTPPSDAAVTASDSARVDIPASNSLTLTKSGSAVRDLDGNGADAGDTIVYTFTVTNTGSTVLAPVTIDDTKLGLDDFLCVASLAPGASVTCPAPSPYVLTQADVDAGAVDNTATVSGGAPNGPDATATDDETVDVDNVAVLTLTKTAGAPTTAGGRLGDVTDAGDTITYSFVVTNSSNLTIDDIAVNDPLLGAVTCTQQSLAPGESTTCTAAPHVLTQRDIDAGSVSNTATVRGTDPAGGAVTDTDSALVVIDPASALTIDKTASAIDDRDGNGPDAGDRITYSFTVTNTGNTTLSIVTVSDPTLKLTNLQCEAVLSPGESVTCTAPHDITQAEVDRGSITNTATATANPPNPDDPQVSATDTVTTAVPGRPAVTIEKTASVPTLTGGRLSTVTDAGDTVTYTITVENTGTVTLDPVLITDAKLGVADVACDGQSRLAPGASATCSFRYVLTQGDIDAGGVDNTASVEGAGPDGTVVDYEDVARVDLPATNAVTLSKSASAVVDNDGNGPDAGDTITYTFTVTNTGATTLAPVTISDSRLGGTFECVATLAPGDSAICAGPAAYVLTQADVDSGAVTNTATATGDAPVGADPTATSSATVDVDNVAVLVLDKQAGAPTADQGRLDTVTDAGDTITYRFTVTNESNLTLTGLRLSDPLLGDITCADTTLEARATTTCTATPYVLTQTDIDRGRVDNLATATAQDPSGDDVGATDTVSAPLTARNGVELTKTAGQPTVDGGMLPTTTDAGDTITYTFTVRNTGSQTLSPVTIDDDKLGLTDFACAASLAPGDTAECTATLTLDQADIDRGSVTNTATTTGTTPAGDTVAATDTITTPVDGAAALEFTKSASTIVDNDGNGADAGDTMTFTFTVRNTGARTLGPITVDDAKLDLGDFPCITTLAPGDTASCEAPTYVLTQDDVDAGVVANSATVTAAVAGGDPVEDASSTRTPLDNLATMTLDKVAGVVADSNGSGRQDADDTVTYTFTVANTSNLTLTGVAVTDPMLGAVTCPSTTLAARATMTCTAAPHVLTQDDIDRGRVDNTATLTATSPQGPVIPVDATEAVELDPVSSMTFVKNAGALVDLDGNGPDEGDTISYSFTVANTGATTLDPVTVSDPLLELTGMPCGSAPLAPGQSRTCPAPEPYVLTQADVDRGSVTNTATGTGTPPAGADPVSAGDDETVTFEPRSALTLTKNDSAVRDPDANGADAGDEIDYSFTVTNTGATTLAPVTIDDPLLALDNFVCVASLAPGDTATCPAPAAYTLTQDDVDAGFVRNVATATGDSPQGVDPEATDDVTTDLDNVATLVLTKTAAAPTTAGGRLPDATDAGDTVTYTFTVENTSNLTVQGIAVTDPKLSGVTCEATTLAPRTSTTCTAAPYVLTQADIDTLRVDNTATVAGTTTQGEPVSDDSTEVVTIEPADSVALEKTAGPVVDGDRNGPDAGDTITYTFTVTNTGSRTLAPVTVDDPRIGAEDIQCAATLAAGESVECTATYTLTQADIDAATVTNTATATGTPPSGGPVDSSGSETSTFTPVNAITITKNASAVVDLDRNGPDAGDEIRYSFVVQNTGAQTLSPVTIDDAKLELAGFVCAPTLAPGETATCEAPEAYVLTQDDVDDGVVTNTARVTGGAPTGPAVTDTDGTTTDLDNVAAVVLEKTAGPVVDANDSGRQDVGDTVTYEFTVTNSSNLTLRQLAVSDPLLAAAGISVDCPQTSLAPGASMTCTAEPYVLTQPDIDRGRVDNRATVTGVDPAGSGVEFSDTESVVLDAASSLTVTKTAGDVVDANSSGRVDEGDTITYTFLVENTGVTTLDPVTVTDAKLGLRGMPCGDGPLAPGASRTCTAPAYVLTQDDADAGAVTNSATASGHPVGGGSPVTSEPSSVTTPLGATSSIALVKTAGSLQDVDGDGRPSVGDRIGYTFAVTNTGATTIGRVTVSDTMLGLDDFVCSDAPLAPGASVTCAAPRDHVLTVGDIDAGSVDNTATATGTPVRPDGTTGTPVTATDDETVELDRVSGVTLVKEAGDLVDANGSGRPDAGDTLAYTFTITNTSNGTLTAVRLTDAKLGVTDAPCGAATLAPGARTTCTVTYVLTQADVDAGQVVNTATVAATDSAGLPVDATDTVTTPVTHVAALELVKAGVLRDGDGDGLADVGETVDYEFTVTNTGTVTVSGLRVTDPKLGDVTCPVTALAPGASATCTAGAYTVTQADVDAGSVQNNATASGTPAGGGETVSGTSSTSTPTDTRTGMQLTKTATLLESDGDGVADAGESVRYEFAVTNTGTTSLVDIRITDRMVGLDAALCDAGPLAPGDTVECTELTRVHQVTASETTGDALRNVATATAELVGGGGAIDDAAAVETPTAPTPPPPAPRPPTPHEPLAFTGSNILVMLGLALALLALGILLLGARRGLAPVVGRGRHRAPDRRP